MGKRRPGVPRVGLALIVGGLGLGLLAPPAVAEHGVTTGAADLAFDGESGALPAGAVSAGATVSGAAARNGSGGLRLSSSAAQSYVRWGTAVMPQGQSHVSVRTWVRVIDQGPAESVDLLTIENDSGAAHFDFFVTGTTPRFKWDLFRDDSDESDFIVDYDRWYLVEAQVEFAGTEHTADVRIDGVPQGTITSAGADTTARLMIVGSHEAKTHTQHYDDVAVALGSDPPGWFDDTSPEVSVRSPGHGVTYAAGRAVVADFDCTDAGGGVDTCAGPVGNGFPIDTTTLGPHEFAVTGADHAGNTTVVNRTYEVGRARPDARIRRSGSQRWLGNNRYGTFKGQTAKGKAAGGRRVTYVVSAQNDAQFAERLKLRGSGSTRRFQVRYYSRSGSNITGKVTAGLRKPAFRTPVLRPGQTFRVRVVVTVNPFTPVGASQPRTLKARSATHDRSDTVRFVTRRI